MRFGKVEDRPLRHYASRVDALVAPVVVLLDVVHVDRLCNAWSLIKILQIAPQVRVVHDTLQVALEVAVVDGVEANERGKEAPVGLRYAVATQVALGGENPFQVVQSIEEFRNGLFVCLLCGSETRAIDAVVDGLVDGVYGRVCLIPQILREEMCVCGSKLAELGVEHADDLARLVVDDGPRLFVPENGRRDASRIVGICLRVDLSQVVGAVHRVGDDAWLVVEGPTVLAHKGPDGGEPDDLFQSFQLAHDRRPVGPRTRPGYV